MTDKELLENAAKAAGVPVDPTYGRPGQWVGVVRGNRSFSSWNPLTDDGDAFRLAVKLGLDVENFSDTISVDGFHEDRGTDDYAATRRAIVRAAAEIGKAMP